MELELLQRTFGLEIELSDMDKSQVKMPSGYSWDEEEVIHNTNGTRGTVTYRYGGEINTPPLLPTEESYAELRSILESCKAAGAIARRDCGLQVHIYIGDLTVEEVKRIYALSYYCTDVLKQICYLPPYSDDQRYRPAPTMDIFERAMQADSFDAMRRVFENSQNKGYVRHFVNVASYFVRKTVEFRLFNTTTDWDEMQACIEFAYRFVDYALTHTLDDFKSLCTCEVFEYQTKVPTNLPKLPDSLIFFSSVRDMDKGITMHEHVDLSSYFVNMLCENSGQEIVCVNPHMYSLETKLSAYKKIVLYVNDGFHHTLYRIVREGVRICYTGKAEFLQGFNADDPVKQVACLMVFHRIRKFLRDGEYYEQRLQSYKESLVSTMENAYSASERLVKMLSEAEYHVGTLNDAIARGGDIFFQFDDYSKYRSTFNSLRENSDFDEQYERMETNYYEVQNNLPKGTKLMLVSTFPYHNMEKIGKIGSKIFYSTQRAKSGVIQDSKKPEFLTFKEPPDDLVIDDPDRLHICNVKSGELLKAQKQYVVKVEKVSGCRFGYFVFYDDYLLGGFGFDYPKNQAYDIWLLSDFSTNNRVPRLSKLILLCVKSAMVRRSLCRKMSNVINTCYTKVYTHEPVSSKYRGPFKKVSRESNHLLYETTLGTLGGKDEIIAKYKQIINNMNHEQNKP